MPRGQWKLPGDEARALAFANIAQIDDDDLGVIDHGDGVRGFNLFNTGARGRDEIGYRGDGLGHEDTCSNSKWVCAHD
jgi:hypothetical protein